MKGELAKAVEGLKEVGATDDEIRESLFDPLVADAVSTLRRAMLNSQDEKLAVNVAEGILDRAGQGRKSSSSGAQIVISDSNINLLLQAQKEALEG